VICSSCACARQTLARALRCTALRRRLTRRRLAPGAPQNKRISKGKGGKGGKRKAYAPAQRSPRLRVC
jgi:hypothetical protein